ncbi:MAG TPA: homocysteine S-methyltransferase family protein [Longimicrobiales bacterium]|nr:homocysteine S-methyltransferase family protein [Longimicrobiales bacterium]
MSASPYLELLRHRVLVYDGAMGTSIQKLELTEADFGGPGLDGCNDYLVISRPDAVEGVHASFLDVGCDVLETDTFRSNRLTLREYGLHERVLEINRAAAALARRVADSFATPDRPRFVAGSIGPSGFLPSTSDPVLGAVTFDELVDVFAEQAQGLIEGGADVLLIETSQDILEVKAQMIGARRAQHTLGTRVPLQVQITLDTSGRMLLGTDIAAATVIIESMRADVIGLNCSTGPEHMRQPVRFLCDNSRLPISVIPNAGIPLNQAGVALYPLEPEALAAAHEEFVTKFGVNIVGGCCGTTPDHLRAVVDRVWGRAPLRRDVPRVARAASAMTSYDLQQDPAPTMIGERVNSQGSRAIKRMLIADDYDGVLEVARGQVDGGAHLLDVCVALTERQDEAEQMSAIVKLLAQSVETPLMIDTTEYDVVEAALKRYPGRAVVNSINLENGRERIERVVPHVVEHGAAVVALTIDEQGMAKTAQRKLEIARRIHDIVCGEYGLSSDSLIFDDLTFTLATGDAEFRRSAIETIDGIQLIKQHLPGVLTSLGVSNVSFGLAKHARAVLNSVFLHHCVEAGLDMAIVNPTHVSPYAEIDAEQRALADDLIFDRREDALARFIAFFESTAVEEEAATDPTLTMEPDQAIHWKILHRKKDGVEDLIDRAILRAAQLADPAKLAHEGAEAARSEGDPGTAEQALLRLEPTVRDRAAVLVLNSVLLPAMKEVGDKFGAGELILPFVLQSAEVMKRSVARLETYLVKKEGQTKGKVVLATVFGDVHDIGKSLVNTILTNNGYTVFDLGKQVPVNTIIEKAQEVGADAIGLSALLVSTSKQMPLCVQELHARGLSYPVLVGGAAINPSFVRMASYADQEKTTLYPAGVFYCKDAFEGLSTIDALMDDERRTDFVQQRLEDVVEGIARREELKAKAARTHAATNGSRTPARDIDIPLAPFLGVKHIARLPLAELFEFFDLNTLYRLHWGAKNAKGPEYERLVREEYEPRLRHLKTEALTGGWLSPAAVYGYFPVAADRDTIIVYDPSAPAREIARFHTPRQADRDELCLADYFAPADSGRRDVAALQVVTVGDELLRRSERMMKEGDYTEGYYLHGFGVRLAEAGAEYVNRLIVRELGLAKGRGLRYSWGYPAIPDHMQHHVVAALMPEVASRLHVQVTEAGALDPELTTAAIVVHHPEAKYFSV